MGSDPAAQGWIKTKHRLLEEAEETVMIPCKPSSAINSSVRELRALPSNTAGKVSEPEVRLIAADKVEWIVPPAVMGVTAGKWTLWEEYDLDYNNSCFCLVFSRPQDCERVYYDRKERREIFFVEGLTVPPGVVSDHATYGFPAPTARYVEIVEGKVVKEHRASHWLYTKQHASRGTIGQRAPTPQADDLPSKKDAIKEGKKPISASKAKGIVPLTSTPNPSSTREQTPSTSSITPQPVHAKSIPTEPRAHRITSAHSDGDAAIQSRRSQLGRRPRTPSPSPRSLAIEEGNRPKRLKSTEVLQPGVVEAATSNSTVPLSVPFTAPAQPESPLPVSSFKVTPRAPIMSNGFNFHTLSDDSADSRFLCFEGLPLDWETCRTWFYRMAISAHFIWINKMYRTITDGTSLIWLDMKSNDDACRLRGYLTHRTTSDNALIISHFVAEATFNEATQSATHTWIRPPPSQSSAADNLRGESSFQFILLEARLTSPRPTSPVPDVTLLHRAGVTLEERVEVLPPRRARGGERHKKHKARQLAKQQRNS